MKHGNNRNSALVESPHLRQSPSSVPFAFPPKSLLANIALIMHSMGKCSAHSRIYCEENINLWYAKPLSSWALIVILVQY